MRKITIAATQMSCGSDRATNLAKAEQLVRQAAAKGAQIILLPELFETVYFCQTESPEYFSYSSELENNPALLHFKSIAKELRVVLPISFFERKNMTYYNTVVIIDGDGEVLGKYRKTHIPDGPGYSEKYYFTPGDTGFQVWHSCHGKIGVGICWDQWYPEAARSMALLGAELIFFPTAIGSEPHRSHLDSKEHWQRCMQGHAAANMIPIIAANRVGTEVAHGSEITFYGSSFLTDATGKILLEADRQAETVLVQSFDLDALDQERIAWGIFRDRRPEMYKTLLTSDGLAEPTPSSRH